MREGKGREGKGREGKKGRGRRVERGSGVKSEEGQ